MKNKFLLVGLLLLKASNTFAQKGFTLSFSLQPSMSTGGKYNVLEKATSNSKFVSMERAFTFAVKPGADVGYNFTDRNGITVGLFYSNQGQKYNDYDYVENNEVLTFHKSFSLSYLQIPIQFHFISDCKKRVTYFLSAGFYMGFLTNYIDSNIYSVSDGSTVSAVATDKNYTEIFTGSFGSFNGTASLIDPPFNNFDFGGVAEAGLQFRLSSRLSIPLSINYQFGFVNVKNKESRFTYDGTTSDYWQNTSNNSPNAKDDYRNSLLGIKVGLKINFPSKAPEKKSESK